MNSEYQDGGLNVTSAGSRCTARFIDPLTIRELEILSLVCEGLSNEEVCVELGIRLTTVKYHVNNIFGKLYVRRRTQAVALAVHLELVKPRWLSKQYIYGSDIFYERVSSKPVSLLIGGVVGVSKNRDTVPSARGMITASS